MGRRLTASEETQLLQQTIREAHEATQALNQAIKEANLLATRLVDDFQAIHDREIKSLGNTLQIEMNQQSADLNQAVTKAREMVLQQMSATELRYDKTTNTVRLLFPEWKFDDHVPIPYPEIVPKEDPS